MARYLISYRQILGAGMMLWTSVGNLLSDPGEVSFSRHILPILSDHCFQCHGPDPAHRKGGLRLDLREEVLGDGASDPVVIPGDPQNSLLLQRIRSVDPDEVMPPEKAHKPLSEDQKQLLERWVAQGAAWEKHWAFMVPRRPDIPKSASHPVDFFIRKRLGQEGLTLSPQASIRTLLRRVSFDLIGLPHLERANQEPPKELRSDFWERHVDRLLESPHFGERMAMWWLDASRYADTDGFQLDAIRSNWAWRDWVIQAFNQNMPFDEFTRLQFAGDLMPGATPETILATCFHRNHMTNGEGGRDPEESRVDYVIDRVNTMGTLWMGLTLGCAQCHSHKFDPVSHAEYYQLSAYFNNIDESGAAGNKAHPYLDFESPLAKAHWRASAYSLQKAQERLERREKLAKDRFGPWLDAIIQQPKERFQPWIKVIPTGLESQHGTTLESDVSGEITAKGINPYHEDYRVIWQPTQARITGVRLKVFKDAHHGNGRYGRGVSGEFILTNAKLFRRERGRQLLHEIPLSEAIADFEAKPKAGERYGKVRDTLDDDPRNGWTTHDDPESSFREAIFVLRDPLTLKSNEELVWVMMHRSTLGDANVGKFALLTTTQAGQALRSLEPSPVEQFIELAPAQSEAIPTSLRKDLYQQFLAGDSLYQQEKRVYDQFASHHREMEAGHKIQKVMVLGERSEPRQAHVLLRGVWDQKGQPVEPDVPSVLQREGSMIPQNRLELADWLVSGHHPLTARVLVNHLWQLIFGAGLVRTPEDFGLQGEPPTHPDLLDWLAVELMESGWNIKHILRVMVTSETYRQKSHLTQTMLEMDPSNRWWSHATRRRLPSWMIHDAILHSSGLMHASLGGPPVRPYQPEGVWQDIFMGRLTYEPSPGASRYRRMIYAFWRRSSSPAFLFDQAQRRICEVRQRLTNTPLQALTLLNDESVLEASQFLSAQCLRNYATREGIEWMAVRILGRPLADGEWTLIHQQYQDVHDAFSQRPYDAKAYITIGQQLPDRSLDPADHAALMWVANMLYNLDEAMTHE